MRKIFSKFLVALSLIAGLSYNAYAAEYNLKMQTWYPPNTAHAAKTFAEEVKNLTDGKVEIMIFTSGELVSSGNILKSVKGGMIDIGHGMGHHFSERKSGTIESGLPLSWMSATQAQVIYDERGLFELIKEEYAKENVVYLGPVWAVPYNILSKSPIHSLDDMRKMKVRAVGATAKMFSALGVSVVNLPPEDIYMALSTGQIDAVVYGSAAEYKETKFYEAAEYINVTPIIDPIADSLLINKKLWDSFTPQIQASIQAAADITKWSYYTWQENESTMALNDLFKGKVTTFSEADIKEMTQAAAKIWEEEGKKSPEAQKGVDIIKQYVTDTGRMQ